MQVYIHREKNVLIEVSFRIMHIRICIPRTFKRFAGFMVCAHAHHARVHPCDVFRADVRVRVRVVLMHVRMRVWAGAASAYAQDANSQHVGHAAQCRQEIECSLTLFCSVCFALSIRFLSPCGARARARALSLSFWL